jgi:hypothetical protein
LDFEGELAAPVTQSSMLDLGKEGVADALSAELGDHRQVVDVEKRASLKGGKTKEADGNAYGSLVREREQHQRRRMTP